jgi:integrase/recombinase XerD
MKTIEMTWDAALVAFEYSQRAQGHAERTIDGYRYVLLRLAKRTNTGPAATTLTDLRAILNEPMASSSKQRYRAIFQVFFRWFEREGYSDVDPSVRLDKVRVQRALPRPLTPQQVQALLESGAYRKTRMMILLGALQGMRVSEIGRMRGEMLDMTENVIRYTSKGAFEKVDELHAVVREEAWGFPRVGYWFPGRGTNTTGHIHGKSVSDLIARAMDRAGITGSRLTAHSLRHHFGTELVEAGVDIRVIQQMMGHRSLSTTAIYTQVSRSKTKAAIVRLPGFAVPDRAERAHRPVGGVDVARGTR